jgi:hypothetical protein
MLFKGSEAAFRRLSFGTAKAPELSAEVTDLCVEA